MRLNKTLLGVSASAILAGLGLFAAAQPASARMVCNAYGDCWHTDARYNYDRDQHVQYHNDDWYFHQRWNNDNDHHYRDPHDGRGYYKNGIWLSF